MILEKIPKTVQIHRKPKKQVIVAVTVITMSLKNFWTLKHVEMFCLTARKIYSEEERNI